MFHWLDARTAGPRLPTASVLAGPRAESDDSADIRRIRRDRTAEKLSRIRSLLDPRTSSTTSSNGRAVRHHDPALALRPPAERLQRLRVQNTDPSLVEGLRDDEGVRVRLWLSAPRAAAHAVLQGAGECHEQNLRAAAESEAERLRRKNPPHVPVRTRARRARARDWRAGNAGHRCGQEPTRMTSSRRPHPPPSHPNPHDPDLHRRSRISN